ncbi:hypothetical protein ACIGNX_01560 [Actinosynnema sp. NPDC053489]|uniref:hypothetical protein n=1 Tax=Actinosynnema sp. NPDC053489 TaxID=3363916 RepID=UPI0037C69C24
MSTPDYSKSSQGMQSGIAALEDHVAAMITSANNVVAISDEIATAYVAGSSTVYRHKMHEWIENYNNVMRKFEALRDNSSTVDRIIDEAEDETHTTALSVQVTAALNV